MDVTDVLDYERPEPDRLLLGGPWQGRTIEVHLRARDLSAMELTGRGFHGSTNDPTTGDGGAPDARRQHVDQSSRLPG